MRPGKLRHWVEVQRPVTTLDAAGQEILDWTSYRRTRAEITPMAGRESWEANTVEGFTTVKIKMRYFPGLTSEHRILACASGKIFSIRGVLDWDLRGREYVVQAIEYRDQGSY